MIGSFRLTQIGEFQPTRIGAFRPTQFGEFRPTRTPSDFRTDRRIRKVCCFLHIIEYSIVRRRKKALVGQHRADSIVYVRLGRYAAVFIQLAHSNRNARSRRVVRKGLQTGFHVRCCCRNHLRARIKVKLDNINAACLLLLHDTLHGHITICMRHDMVCDDHAHIDFRRALDFDTDLFLDIGAHGVLPCCKTRLVDIAIDDGRLPFDNFGCAWRKRC